MDAAEGDAYRRGVLPQSIQCGSSHLAAKLKSDMARTSLRGTRKPNCPVENFRAGSDQASSTIHFVPSWYLFTRLSAATSIWIVIGLPFGAAYGTFCNCVSLPFVTRIR